MAQDLNDALDRLAAEVGFRFTGDPLDFIQPRQAIAARKATQLKQYLDARKAAIELGQPTPVDARAQLLAGTALAGANPTPEELKTFQPGRPSVLDFSVPAGTLPPVDGSPPIITPSASPQAQRLDTLEATAAANAPQLEELRRTLALHDAGLDESKIAQARAYGELARLRGGQADEQDFRFKSVKEIAENPELDQLLRADIVQDKPVFKKERVKVRHKDGREVYYDATPSLSGGYDYTPALDERGQPLTVPVSATDRSTALQKNAQFVARVLFADDPDAEYKAVEMLTRLKTQPPTEAWASLTREVVRQHFHGRIRDPNLIHEKTAELWRVARPGVPIPVDAPAAPPAAAPSAEPGAAPAPKPAAPAAPSAYRTAEEVKAAYRAGQLPRAEAVRLLKGFGFE